MRLYKYLQEVTVTADAQVGPDAVTKDKTKTVHIYKRKKKKKKKDNETK